MRQQWTSVTANAAKRVSSLFVLFRWQFWGVSLIPVMIGSCASPISLDWGQLALLAIIFGPCLEGASEALNDYFDVDVDQPHMIQRFAGVQLSGGTGILLAGSISRSTALALSLIAYAIGLTLSVCHFSTLFAQIVVAGTAVGIAYSAPPLRLKGRGIWGPVSIGLAFGFLTLLAGYCAGGSSPDASTVLRMVPPAVIVSGLFLTHQIVDHQLDSAAAVKTFSVRHGIPATRITSVVLIVAGVFATFATFSHAPAHSGAVAIICGGLTWVVIALCRDKITPVVRVGAVVLEALAGVLFVT